jgi:hypothetical protein
MSLESGLEMRYLCAVAGQREKHKKDYGSRARENPIWFETLIEKYKGVTGIECCFDHKRVWENTVISEPYDLHIEDFRKLIKFCDDNNLSFIVDGNAAHFPGRTFRIILARKGDGKRRASTEKKKVDVQQG